MNQQQQLDLLLHWARNAKRAQYAHYRMASRYRRQYTFTGVIITLITVVAGSSVLADLTNYFPGHETEIRLFIGLLILLASALSGIQTFLKLEKEASNHSKTGASYSAIKRHLDQLIATVKSAPIETHVLDTIRTQLDNLGSQLPQVPDKIWVAILKQMPALDFKDYYPEAHRSKDA